MCVGLGQSFGILWRVKLYMLTSGEPWFLSLGSVRSGDFCLLLFDAYTGDLQQGPLLPLLPFLQDLAASLLR